MSNPGLLRALPIRKRAKPSHIFCLHPPHHHPFRFAFGLKELANVGWMKSGDRNPPQERRNRLKHLMGQGLMLFISSLVRKGIGSSVGVKLILYVG